MNISSVSSDPRMPVVGKQQDQLKKACQDFEAMFLSSLMKSMRKTVVQTDIFGSAQKEDMFKDMMDSEICKSAAKTSSVGIADMMYRQLNHDSRLSIGSETSRTEGEDR